MRSRHQLQNCEAVPAKEQQGMTTPYMSLPRKHSQGRMWKVLMLVCCLTFRAVVVQVLPTVVRSSGAPKALQQKRTRCGWQVSSAGRCRDSRGSIRLGCTRSNGYRYVKINERNFYVHRLVAHAFLGPRSSEATWQVNHLDGNASNNQCSNLVWVTPSQNVQHSYSCLARRKCTLGHSKPVVVNGTKYSSITEAAQKFRLARQTVSNRCQRNAKADGCEYQFFQHDDGMPFAGEEWKPMINPSDGMLVPGRMVSSHGRITSKWGIFSFGCKTGEGYTVTTISNSSQKRTHLIHRIVAYAFLGPPPAPKRTQVNHKDGNNSNNSVANLEYVTPLENVVHRYANQKGPLSNWKPVLSRACGSNDEWRHHASITLAAHTLGLRRTAVSRCARGKYTQTGGYEFRLVEKEQDQELPGEEWRDVDLDVHLRAREMWKKK